MKTQTIKNAQKVLELFPSTKELMNSPEMWKLVELKVMNPLTYGAFLNSQCWEGLSQAVDNMCYGSQGRAFTNGYGFGKEKGTAHVLPCFGNAINIDSLTVYTALLVVMFCSWMNIGCFTRNKEDYLKNKSLYEKQSKAYDNFRFDDELIYRILD